MIFSAFISSIFFFLFFVADGLLCIDLQCVGTRGEVVVIMYSLSSLFRLVNSVLVYLCNVFLLASTRFIFSVSSYGSIILSVHTDTLLHFRLAPSSLPPLKYLKILYLNLVCPRFNI